MTDNNELLAAVGHEFQSAALTYQERDVALYALAVGAAANPLDTSELQYVYELNQDGFRALPTFAVTYPLQALEQIGSIPGLKLNLMEVLHGEHHLELKRPLPTSGTINNQAHISAIYDKGSGALLIIEINSYDAQGQHLALNRAGLFVRGRGSFGGDRGPAAPSGPPARPADAVVIQATTPDQALLYRLASGDRNPLHADGRFAALLGFERPILHGLCTYGFAGRAVLETFAENDPARLKSISARFSQHVFPGETLSTELWHTGDDQVQFQTSVLEREALVLTHGRATLNAPAAAGESAETAVPRSRAIFAEINERIAAHPEWLEQVGAVFQFEIEGSEGGSYIVDLRHSPGAARPGHDLEADCHMTMAYEDFRAMLKGELKPEMAFLTGKLQVSGNLLLATKLGPLFARR
jgi:3-hydroxyacyl-CoA dehydrogenase/3a,7a,12a-trihydroxy-5b-cholest-24-enoyl-CoA hydratase